MACFSPFDAFQRADGSITFAERGDCRPIRLRCRHCVGCRRDHQQAWAARILHESQMHKHSWFVTLTYADSSLPVDGSLTYRHFQLFMYRLRQHYGKVRFFMSGEYGTKTDRPHYHAIFFGVEVTDLAYYKLSEAGSRLYTSATLQRLWKKGFCVLGAVTFESAAYVASYVNKKLSGPKAANRYLSFDRETGEITHRVPEFAQMSRNPGIGSTWLDKYRADCFPRDHVMIHERRFPLPVYYSRKLKKLRPFEFDDVQYERSLRSNPSENVPARLAAREAVLVAKLSKSRRTL